MNSEIELKLLKEIEELKQQVATLNGQYKPQIPTYQYSKIRDTELKKLFEIKQELYDHAFDELVIADLKPSFPQTRESRRYTLHGLKANFIYPQITRIKSVQSAQSV